ncbi:hypothetical protein A7G45_16440 [Mycolicibacterium llatzerense]|nr:hypothetical protein [Mycolicibacterium llatzerense]MCT7372388.1 hypothetical protein [Mycolicibacterium llatzerense]
MLVSIHGICKRWRIALDKFGSTGNFPVKQPHKVTLTFAPLAKDPNRQWWAGRPGSDEFREGSRIGLAIEYIDILDRTSRVRMVVRPCAHKGLGLDFPYAYTGVIATRKDCLSIG